MSFYRKFAGSMLLGMAAAGAAHAQAPDAAATAAATAPTDPLQWLEEVAGEKPMAWVHQHNAVSINALRKLPRTANGAWRNSSCRQSVRTWASIIALRSC